LRKVTFATRVGLTNFHAQDFLRSEEKVQDSPAELPGARRSAGHSGTASAFRQQAHFLLGGAMKNIADVLKQKEAELERIQHEIEALRIAERLLSDEGDSARPLASTGTTQKSATLRQFP